MGTLVATVGAMPKRKKLNLPRVPLPRQRGGSHKVKTKVLDRKRKHKKITEFDVVYGAFSNFIKGM